MLRVTLSIIRKATFCHLILVIDLILILHRLWGTFPINSSFNNLFFTLFILISPLSMILPFLEFFVIFKLFFACSWPILHKFSLGSRFWSFLSSLFSLFLVYAFFYFLSRCLPKLSFLLSLMSKLGIILNLILRKLVLRCWILSRT